MGFDGSSYHPERPWRPRRGTKRGGYLLMAIGTAIGLYGVGVGVYYAGKATADFVSERASSERIARIMREAECSTTGIPRPNPRCD